MRGKNDCRKADNEPGGALPEHSELHSGGGRAGENSLSVRGFQRRRQLLGVLPREPDRSGAALHLRHHFAGLPGPVHCRQAPQKERRALPHGQDTDRPVRERKAQLVTGLLFMLRMRVTSYIFLCPHLISTMGVKYTVLCKVIFCHILLQCLLKRTINQLRLNKFILCRIYMNLLLFTS